MKVYLELEVNEDDLFITNNGIMPIKDIKDEYLNIGKYQFKFVKEYHTPETGYNKSEPCWSCKYLQYSNYDQKYYCHNDEVKCGYYWSSDAMESVKVFGRRND
mgnify:CR=1 FL=1